MGVSGAPERWLVLEVDRPSDPEVAGLLIEELMLLGGRGVEEQGDKFLVYLPRESDSGEAAAELRGRLAHLHGLAGLRVAHRWQPHAAWEEIWREGFPPRRISDRLVVSPTWAEPEMEPGDILLQLDPGMAFGTAEHATTRGSLRLLDASVEPGDRVADIGAGSGILSIAAALLGADRVVAVEMEPWSCAVARENAELNGVDDRIEVHERTVGPDFLPGEPPFDGIVANIESGVLVPLLPGMVAGLQSGGWLILSGILVHEAGSVRRAAEGCGLRLRAEDREDGWWTGAFEGPSAEP